MSDDLVISVHVPESLAGILRQVAKAKNLSPESLILKTINRSLKDLVAVLIAARQKE